jgi:predicted ATPase
LTVVHERFPTRQAYPFHLPLFQATARVPLQAPVTFFVGENGTGKSTLLAAIARAAGIHIWESSGRVAVHPNPHADRLCECIDLDWTAGVQPGSFFAAEIFHGFAELVDSWARSDPGLLGYFGGDALTEKSHGQCNMAFFASRFGIRGLYLLDEPESALSPRRQIELLEILDQASRQGQTQFIVATHSPILLSLPGARILSFDHCPIREIPFEDTSNLRVFREFLDGLPPRR